MPKTEPLVFSDITSVLTPSLREIEVPTSIVFARLIDFIRYMEDDPFDLLFARNVRLWLGKTTPNKEIENTFKKNPQEFAYSNNGITLLCKTHKFDPGKRELILENPRVVNGSQTLHSIRNTDDPSKEARVMVRIIEIPPESGDLPQLRAKRREVIHKISIRSNMQNPIKRWNLVCNDDYQNELFQLFRKKKLFYERRQNEWKMRKDDLRSIGISQGPEIRKLTQLIASYYYDQKELGPANAQGQLDQLFDEDPYMKIRNTPPKVAYKIYLLGQIMYRELRRLSDKFNYIYDAASYTKFSVFSVLCRTINRKATDIWKSEDFEKFLEAENDDPKTQWTNLIKIIIKFILSYHKKAEKRAKKTNMTLTLATFFKNATDVNPILCSPLPREVAKQSKGLFTF